MPGMEATTMAAIAIAGPPIRKKLEPARPTTRIGWLTG